MLSSKSVDLSVSIGKTRLKNPVMPASGTFGYGQEYADFLDINELGAIIVKGTTVEPRLGNFEDRFIEIAGCCSLCNVGLHNVGVKRFIKEKLPYLRQFDTPVFVNIGGESVDEFAKVADALSGVEGVSGVEINISCPNMKKGGMTFGLSPDTTFEVVNAVRKSTDLTVIAKLTPNVTDIGVMAKACEAAGADAISLINSLLGLSIDIYTRKPKLGRNIVGGLGGPWIKPLAVRLVWKVAQTVKLPVIGIGGITGAEDALEFLIAGATAVEIGRRNFIDPTVTIKTIQGIRQYLIDNKIDRISDIIGSFQAP